MKYYPQFKIEEIEEELPMIKGRALINLAMNRDGWLNFSGLQCLCGGYVKAEMDKLVEAYNNTKT